MATSEGSATENTANSNKTNKLALVVGVNNSLFPNTRELLQHAERDAGDMAWALRESMCGFTLIEPILRGSDAKTWEVQHKIMELTKKGTSYDFLLFYFSGHAQPIETPGGHRDIYLVTHDFSEDDVNFSPTMHISMRWLRETLYNKAQAGAVLLILDCCYAGNIIRSEADRYHIDLGKLIEDWLEEPSVRVRKDCPRAMLTATGYDVTAQERSGHGLMTHWILRALHGEDSEILDDNGHVDIFLLHKYLKKKIPEQFPNLAGEFGQYPWVLASHPDHVTRFQQQAVDDEVSRQVDRLNSVVTYFESLTSANTSSYTQAFDHSACENASFSDLEEEKVREFSERRRVQQDSLFHSDISHQDLLKYFGMLQQSHLTYGTLLCFGKNPPQWLSGAKTRCIEWKTNDRHSGWRDDQEYRGGLLKQFEASRDFLKKCLRLSRTINKEGSVEDWEIPIRVLEEVLANALVHREYANPMNFVHRTDFIQVEVFNDRVEISSPGDLPFPMTLAQLQTQHKSHPRNPQIASIFYLYGYIEEVGTGIQRIQKLMKEASLRAPKFNLNGDNTFSVILYRPKDLSELPEKRQMDRQALVRLPSDLSNLVVEVLHNRGDDNHPDWSVGSGLFVGPKLVLTALHNIHGPGELLVRVHGTDEYPAVVRLQGHEGVADLAIIEASDATVDVPPLRYGAVNRSALAMVERCWAVGFPRFKERFSGLKPKRLTAHVEGKIPTLENLGYQYQLLTFQITKTPRGASSLHDSEWQGMSGAVVFAEDTVVGVVSEHDRYQGESTLTVVPMTAIDDLIDEEKWWQMLGINRSHLTILPSPEATFQTVGLHVWTDADMRHYHSLREEFVSLSGVFDYWLTSGPQKRGQRVRVLWLQGEEGTHRTQALMSCLAGAVRDRVPVYDAGANLSLFAKTLEQLLFSKSYLLPPLICVELSADKHGTVWTDVRNGLTSAEKQSSEDHQAYPLLIVAGTGEQAQEAWQTLQERVEIKIIDTMGRDRERPYSYHGVHGMDSATVSREDIFNRGLPITMHRLFGREDELKTLTQAWNSDRCRILSLVAYGGTGKSALVNTWLSQMRDQDYLGARKVFAWSFYSQGTKENLVSADLFVNQALTWLAPGDPVPLNPWAQGLALARLIKKHRFLLVLDGLEPLQHPLSAPDVGGQLTDDALRALLEELSDPSDWKGLCVITTRVPLTDLRRFEDANQGEMGRVIQLNLENLDYQAGAALLKYLIKADARQRDLEKVVAEVQGHALAITLLGNYLRDVHNGDLAGRFDLEKLTVAEREGGHARRVMASYMQWLQQNQRFAELALLHIIGLFDRPAPPEAMSALLTDRDLHPFTAKLDQVGGTVWNQCVDALRGMGLLNKENPEWPGTLDAHPLVREHFRDEMQKGDGQMWAEGNRRLFAYYCDMAPPQPADSKDMNTLYAAVTHGCAAGLHQQVFDKVLLSRIWRNRRTNYSTRRLGMTGSDLVALSNYFQHRQWTQLQGQPLSEPARILILTNAGVRLRQLGRLVEARQCFSAVVREIESSSAEAKESEDASYASAQYCELLVIAGKLIGTNDDSDTALVNGLKAITFADRGTDLYFSMHARSSLAEVHFMLGDLEKASTLFEEAKAIEQNHHPKPPFLYSQSLFRYGYYLIETGRAQELLANARQSEDWGKNGKDTSLLSRAIRSLILGAAHRAIMESGERAPTFINEAEKILDSSIIEFRTAGYADYTVRGLLERTHFYRIRQLAGDYRKTLEDLDQATFEAQRGQMELLYADILLQRLACYLDFWPTMSNADRTNIRDKVIETLTEATDLIKKLQYGRRYQMLADLQTIALQHGTVH